MRDDTVNSHYLAYTFLLKKGRENVLFALGSEKVHAVQLSSPAKPYLVFPELFVFDLK